ncbi:hypothetical protein QZH41_001609 [Actinostola sp. cb2023]|nr:hypothetical protein QZH41_001609 [Actinostola sp. cb2023]
MEPSNWQTQLSTVRERNEYAFNKSLFCDVEFSVVDANGDKVTIPANKYILAISSPVFEAMFYGKLAETKPTIDLSECSKEGLHELLRYVNSDEVNLTGSNVLEVLYLAEKYMMPFLAEKCKNHLQNEVGPDDVFSILHVVRDEQLQKHFWNIVDSKTQQAVSSEPFLNVSREMLCQILRRDALNISELELFYAVDRWVGKRIEEKGLVCNGETKLAILGEEVVRLIRFPLMTQKEFAEVVLPCKILDTNEITELVQTFNNVSPTTRIFTKKERSWGCLFIPCRFRTIKGPILKATPLDSRWNYESNHSDAIDFTVSEHVDLVGVRLFGSQGSKYDVELNIYKNEQSISQLSSSFLTESEMIDDLYYGFTVTLGKPVKLDPSVVYTVEATICGPPSYFGESDKEFEVVADGEHITCKIIYQESSKSINSTSVIRGQFPTLIFRK